MAHIKKMIVVDKIGTTYLCHNWIRQSLFSNMIKDLVTKCKVGIENLKYFDETDVVMKFNI